MKPRLIPRADAQSVAPGLVLAQDVRGEGGRVIFGKGDILDATCAVALRALSWAELHFVEMEPGDLHEGAAGARLAAAVAGPFVEVQALAGGAWPLVAKARGLLEVDEARLARVNALDDVVIYTQPHRQIVLEGELLGRAKIVPFVTAESGIRAAERIAAEGEGVLRVRPFRPARVAAVVAESLDEGQLARFRRAFTEKLAFFGSELVALVVAANTAQGLSAALRQAVREGAEVVAVAGSKPMDPLDPALRGLAGAGGRLEAYGAPMHPGTLFWLGYLGDALPVLGMPSCGLFSKATVLDLLLPRILAGERIGRAQIAALGCGGLLTRDMAFRFPPYSQKRERGELDPE